MTLRKPKLKTNTLSDPWHAPERPHHADANVRALQAGIPGVPINLPGMEKLIGADKTIEALARDLEMEAE